MSLEIVFDIAGEDAGVLSEIERGVPEAEVQHLSGLGGLELIGTIAIPSTALVLQVISMLQAAMSKPGNTTIVQVNVYRDERSVTINVKDPGDLKREIDEAVARLK